MGALPMRRRAAAGHSPGTPRQTVRVTTLDELRAEIAAHESNAWATARGWEPLVIGESTARILILSQAPGRLAQESGIAFDDPSGRLLRSWMGVTDAEFWDPAKVAILPMDAYFPGSRGAPAVTGSDEEAVASERTAAALEDAAVERAGAALPGEPRPAAERRAAAMDSEPARPPRGGGDLPPRRDFADRWHPRVLELLPEVRLRLVIGGYAQRRYLGPGNVTEHVRDAASHLPFFPLVHPSPLARGWRSANPWFAESTVPMLQRLVREALEGE